MELIIVFVDISGDQCNSPPEDWIQGTDHAGIPIYPHQPSQVGTPHLFILIYKLLAWVSPNDDKSSPSQLIWLNTPPSPYTIKCIVGKGDSLRDSTLNVNFPRNSQILYLLPKGISE